MLRERYYIICYNNYSFTYLLANNHMELAVKFDHLSK
jgi:hypothetical protein